MVKNIARNTCLSVLLLICAVSLAKAEDFKGEVVELGGHSKLNRAGKSQNISKGLLIQTGDSVEVGGGSTLLIALDGDMQNLVRLTGPTSVKISSLYPTLLTLYKGDLLAKLNSLPTDSSFEIETPVGVAAVRGTEFRAVYKDTGLEIFNLSSSDVYVFNKELSGILASKPVIVPQAQKTAIARLGVAPVAPQRMADNEMRDQRRVQDRLGEDIRSARSHKPQLPPIAQIHKEYGQNAREHTTKARAGLVAHEQGKAQDPRASAFDRQNKFFDRVRMAVPEGNSTSVEKRPESQPERKHGFHSEERPGFTPGEGASLHKDINTDHKSNPHVHLPKMGEHRPHAQPAEIQGEQRSGGGEQARQQQPDWGSKQPYPQRPGEARPHQQQRPGENRVHQPPQPLPQPPHQQQGKGDQQSPPEQHKKPEPNQHPSAPPKRTAPNQQ